METKFERLDDDKVKIDVTFDVAEVDEAIDSVYDEVKKSARIPGFRKGKTPRKVLEHQFGPDYFGANATVNLIEKHSPEIVDSNGYVPYGDYDYDADEAAKQGEAYSYSFTIQVKPEYELTSTDPVSVQALKTDATEKEIDERIDTLLNYYVDLNHIDGPAKETDIVAISQECFVNGEEIEEGHKDYRSIIMEADTVSQEFKDQLLGTNVDDKKEFVATHDDLDLPEEYGDKIDVKIEVQNITEKIVPELTDEWVKENCGVDSVDKFREQIATEIAKNKKIESDTLKVEACLEELASRLEGDAPDYMIEAETSKILRRIYTQLQSQGYTLDQYLMVTSTTPDDFYEDTKKKAKLSAKECLALDALARAQKIECTEEDLQDTFEKVDPDNADELRREWESEYQMSVLREEVIRDKASKWLSENAIVEYVDELPEKVEEPEDADVSEEAKQEEDVKSDKPKKASKASKSAKSEKSDELDKSDKPKKTTKSTKSTKTTKSTKSTKKDKDDKEDKASEDKDA